METVTHGEFASASQREVDRLLAHYGESHQNPRNERIHFVAIPLIMLSLLGLLWAAHPWLAVGFVAASLVYYARLSLVFLLAMAILSGVGLGLVYAMGSLVLPLVGGDFRGRVDRAVHRPQDRRQEAFVLRRPAVPVGRPAVRAEQTVRQARRALVEGQPAAPSWWTSSTGRPSKSANCQQSSRIIFFHYLEAAQTGPITL